MGQRIVILCMALGLSTSLAQSFYEDSLYLRGQKLYFLSTQSEKYLQETERVFEMLIRRYGPHPPLQMYLYGITALKARYASNLLKKREYLFTAIAQMDAQVERTPDDIEVRFIRGSFYYYLPFFLGKRKFAQSDLKSVASLLLRYPDQYTKRYSGEVLRAIVSFLRETEWLEEEQLAQLEKIYFRRGAL
ncbi:MAG: hypothetical protein RMJ66_08470 [Bacteroidia bacterium]|nr:hypothetical protein [Bacteroidia bacterium]MDW8135082.1 hypothetical protein [Bacteroidia bacterium]